MSAVVHRCPPGGALSAFTSEWGGVLVALGWALIVAGAAAFFIGIGMAV